MKIHDHFFQNSLMNRNFKRTLLISKYFFNIINALTVTFDHFIASLLSKMIQIFLTTEFWMLLLTGVVCAADNWALIYAQQLALAEKLPLHICFCLVPRYLDATYRQYAFMLKGLREVAKVQKYYISRDLSLSVWCVCCCAYYLLDWATKLDHTPFHNRCFWLARAALLGSINELCFNKT